MVTAYESLVWSVDTSFEIVWRQIWWSVATSCDSILVERSLVEWKKTALKTCGYKFGGVWRQTLPACGYKSGGVWRQALPACRDKYVECGDKLWHVGTSLVECGDKLGGVWRQAWLSVETSLVKYGDKLGWVWRQVWLSVETNLAEHGDKLG